MKERYNKLDKYIEKCMPSKEMQDYLKEYDDIDGLYLYHIIDMIACSPVCDIYEKLQYLKEIEPITEELFKEDYDIDQLRKESYYNYTNQMEYCIESLKNKQCIYTIEEFSYDKRANYQEGSLSYICNTIEEAKNLISANFEEYYVDALYWIELTQWLYIDNKYVPNVDLVFINNRIIYYRLKDYGENHVGGHIMALLWESENLNLPVPFKAGTIVEIDGFPFYPKCLCMILSIGDNADCCSICGMTKNFDSRYGRWNIGAVKHTQMIDVYGADYKISPLYSIKAFTGELPEDLKIFSDIEKYIDHDEEKGSDLSFKHSIESCVEDILKLMSKKL